MSLSSAERAGLRRELMEMAGEAFDAMFDDDQQEQLITMTQREDRVLQKGAELQSWLLARHLARDPWGQPKPSEEGAEAVLEVRAAYLSQDGRADRNWALPRPRYRALGRNRLALVN